MTSNDERAPLRGEPEGISVSMVSLLVAGGAYALGSVPLSLFVITQHKVEIHKDALDTRQVSMGLTLFYVGWACSALTLIPCADYCGRKWLYCGMVTTGLLATFLSTRAQSTISYAATIFFIGFLLKPSTQVGYLLLQEHLPKRFWATAIVTLNDCYSLAGFLVAVVGSVLVDLSWRIEVLLWHIPFVLIALIGPLVLSESQQFVKSRPMPVNDCSSWHLLQLWTSPDLRFRTIMTLPCWVACSVGFNCLSFAVGSLSHHFYTNLALLSIADLVGYSLAWPIVRQMGERRAQLAAFLVAMLLLLACTFMHAGRWRVTCAVLGRLALDVAFTTIYLNLLQHFPPEVRGSATGTVNCIARLLGFVAPLFPLAPFPALSASIAGLCLLSAASTWALPEAAIAASGSMMQGGYTGKDEPWGSSLRPPGTITSKI